MPHRPTSLIALAVASIYSAPALASSSEDPTSAVTAIAADPDPATDQGPQEEDPPSQQQEVVVIGSRRTDRTVAESSVPIDVFSEEVLENQASGDMNQVLRNLMPSFNVGRFAISDGSTFVRPPTLRGLPPDEILVLVNGKRRHRSALVQLGGGSLASGAQGPDLAQIPTIAIDRIEVLRDGAAAQYGSDAIAGVINYNLKRDPGFKAIARYGQYYEGDGENYQLAANAGVKLGDSGFLSVSGEYLNSAQTSRGGQRFGAYALGVARPDLLQGIRNPVQIFGDPEVEAYRFFANSAIEAGPGEFYVFGNYGHADQAGDFNYRQSVTVAPPYPAGLEDCSRGACTRSGVFNTIYLDRLPNGTYDANGGTFSYASLFPSGFTPRFMGTVTDYSAVGGYRGAFEMGLTYDLSVGWGRSQIDYFMNNTVNPSLGPDSPTEFFLGFLRQTEFNINLDFTMPITVAGDTPLTLAFGGERRVEAYTIGLGDEAGYAIGPYAFQQLSNGSVASQPIGANGFPGYGPDSVVHDSRESYALYVEADADATDALTLSFAARFEHFEDFGDTLIGKVTARYAFSDAIAIRGAASTGFRAPTPGQLFTTNVATQFQGSQPIETATYPATNPAAAFFGAEALAPEESANLTAGMVLTPVDGLTLTADYYNIEVTDRIGLSGNFDITTTAQREALRGLGVANWASLGRVRFFTNAFDTRTQGVDLVATWVATTGFGRFSTSAAFNWNETKVTDFDPSIISRERKGEIENLNPKWRGNITETFSSGGFGLVARANYYGPFTSYATTANGGDLRVGSEWTFDLEASYEITENFKLSVGAENLFDNYPDLNIRALGAPNSNWYPVTGATVSGSRYVDDSPFGWNGGFWYARLVTSF
ncbi:TonB-dependent receptor plug domain-containing protein [Sphingomonas sp. DT-207]|uniref:TonB-dependent receptor plug domain-containing protein n=1 Tax=Sphingomonas sp. DT-207 TaxID=3396167 RepID=UPI003F1C4EAC